MSPTIQSTYSSELSTTSASFSRTACATQRFYYEALQFIITVNGSFDVFSKSEMDTFGVIHKESFDPLSPSVNHVADDDNSCESGQFGVRISLEVDTIYVLVATTNEPDVLGQFTVVVLGPAHVALQSIGELNGIARSAPSNRAKSRFGRDRIFLFVSRSVRGSF